MTKYRRSRMLSTAVVAVGLLVVIAGVLLVAAIAALPFSQAAMVPFVGFIAAGLALALFGCLARAFFDIAETITGGGNGA